MTLLIAGLMLWVVLHFIPSLAIPFRSLLIDRFGERKYKICFALLVALSVVLIVFGWRSTEFIGIYTPPGWSGPVTGLLMIATFILFSAAHSENNVRRFIRHPQLTGLVVWSFAHLFSNGDSRSLVVFGVFGIWAVAEMVLINRRERDWVKPAPVPLKPDLIMVTKGIVIFFIFLFAHPYFFGVSPIVL